MEHIIFVSGHNFQTWANKLSEKEKDQARDEHVVWIVPAPVYARQYDHDERYLSENSTSDKTLLVGEGQNNAEFHQMQLQDSCSELRSHFILDLRAMKNIDYTKSSM